MQVCIVRAASESQSMADFSDFFSFFPAKFRVYRAGSVDS